MAFDMHSPEIKLIHVFLRAYYPSCETTSRTNLQLAALHKEIDRSEDGQEQDGKRHAETPLPSSDRVDSAELCLSKCRSLSQRDCQNA